MKRIISNRIQQYKLHILLWTLFIFYEAVVIGLITGRFGHPLAYLFHYLLAVCFFYVHAEVGLTWALKSRVNSFWKLPLFIAIEIVVYILVCYFVDELLINTYIFKSDTHQLTFQDSLTNLYRCIYFMGFSTGYYFILRYNKEKMRTNELEKQRLTDIINLQKSEQELIKSQNAFLKAQINPHFLFNTLDFIYHNIGPSSQAAADAVIILSEIMRYAIDSDKIGDFIVLGDEIDQVVNLLYLRQMRTNFNLCFKFIYEDEVRTLKFIPLVLLTVVENIFKHGRLNVVGQEATVRLHIENNIFFIETDNLIDKEGQRLKSHIGLVNIAKRLRYTFDDKVNFTYYTSKDNHFKLSISLPVHYLRLPDEPLIPLEENDII
ncbi:MAG: Histidine kinase [Mucilaginibacter sp.]|nr:Histidine kinase [Mucilaginibacter sp.]